MKIYNIKNLFSLVLLLGVTLLSFSCSDDDNTPSNEATNDDLDGVFIATSYEQAGVEFLPNVVAALQLTFTASEPDGGSFAAVTTDLSGGSSTAAASYTVVDDGNRIVIGTDTLDLEASSTSLTLEGNILFAAGEVTIVATKQ